MNELQSCVTFSKIFEAVIAMDNLSAQESFTYLIFLYRSWKNGYCWHSQLNLAKQSHCSLSTFARTLKGIIRKGLIRVEKTLRGLRYFPFFPIAKTSQLNHQEIQVDHVKMTYSHGQNDESSFKEKKKIKISSYQRSSFVQSQTFSSSALQKGRVVESDDFQKIWEAYPRKEAIGLARITFSKMKRSLPTIDCLLDCISFKKRSCWADKESQYIPSLSCFLKGERWLDSDYIDYKAAAKPKPSVRETIPELTMKFPEYEETPEESQGIISFLDSIDRRLSMTEKGFLRSFWRGLYRKGITLTAQDGAHVGNGALFTEMNNLALMRSLP